MGSRHLQDIFSCAKGAKKKISLGSVSDKIKELRKAAEEKKRQQAMVPAQGESQFEFGSDNDEEEEEEKSETEEDAEDYTTYNEAQLDASIARMKAELAVATKQHEVGPVKVVLKKYNQALNDEKKTIERGEYLRRKKEINDVKEYFTEDVRKKDFSLTLSLHAHALILTLSLNLTSCARNTLAGSSTRCSPRWPPRRLLSWTSLRRLTR